jgi:glyoxylase-like metal-dependent hydrolase (beta-lactamase superfamily II)
MRSRIRSIALILGLALVFLPLQSQEQPPISIEKVAGNVYCLYGQGGNIGILEGEDALLVVDSQYAQNAADVLKAIKELSRKPIKFLLNTHYHGDHTGGNPIVGKGAEIISHAACKASFLKGLKPEQAPETMGAPEKTYDTDMTLQVGSETVSLLHPGPGHTSGDTIVVFEESKVIHTGDLFFNGLPPYIDVADGADTHNWFRTIDTLAKKYPDFKLIPGHGKVADMKAWLEFSDYLKMLREKVAAAIQAGKSREETMESVDLSRYANIQDMGEFLTKKNNVGWVYDEMSRQK